MSKSIYWALILSAGLLASCSSPKNTSKMNASEAKVTAEAALGDLSMGSLVGGPAGIVGQDLRAAQQLGLPLAAASVLQGLGLELPQAVTAGCQVNADPNWTDADLDFTPVSISLSVDCSYTDNANTADTADDVLYAFKGSLKLEDTNDNQANSGYKLTLSNWKETASKGGKSLERTLGGSLSLNIPAGATVYSLNKAYTAAQTYTEGSQTDTSSVQFGLEQTYTPDSTSQPKKSGNYSVDKAKPGTLKLTHNANTYLWSVYTDPSLHFVSSCKAKTPKGVRIPFDSGSASYSYLNPDGVLSSLVIRFTACGVYTLTLDGQAVQ